MLLSACGLNCNDCPFFSNPCLGCYEVKGRPFWTKDASPNGICQLFDCSVNQNGYKNCGSCTDLPCQMFRDLKDPAISQEEHEKNIEQRVKVLKGI